VKFNDLETPFELEPIYLKYMDDKIDHIFVDEKINITNTIGWSFDRIVPTYEAFCSSLVTVDIDDIISDSIRASRDHWLLAHGLQATGVT
jgi:hypothetical protein